MLSIAMLRTERAVEMALSSAVHVPVRTKVFRWGSQERACPSAVCHLIIEGLHPPGLFNTATSLSIKLTNKRFSSKPLVLGTVPWVSFFWQSSPCAHMCWIVATPSSTPPPRLDPAAQLLLKCTDLKVIFGKKNQLLRLEPGVGQESCDLTTVLLRSKYTAKYVTDWHWRFATF